MAALSQLHGKVDNADMFYEKGLILEDGKLMHLFWVNGTSRIDYQCFGDVVAFNATYKKNKYNKPMATFQRKIIIPKPCFLGVHQLHMKVLMFIDRC